jgi:RNA polymerase-binding protein DksA
MDKRTREKYRKRLLAEKEKILNQINNLSEGTLSSSQRDSSGDLSGYSMHMADVGTDNFQRELALGLVSNEQQVLYRINEALRRVDDGTYGKCEECGSNIKETRLKALPFATMCISCKEKDEARGGR